MSGFISPEKDTTPTRVRPGASVETSAFAAAISARLAKIDRFVKSPLDATAPRAPEAAAPRAAEEAAPPAPDRTAQPAPDAAPDAPPAPEGATPEAPAPTASPESVSAPAGAEATP